MQADTDEKPKSPLPSRRAVQALEDSLLKAQALLSKKLKSIAANSGTSDKISHVRMYYQLRKI